MVNEKDLMTEEETKKETKKAVVVGWPYFAITGLAMAVGNGIINGIKRDYGWWSYLIGAGIAALIGGVGAWIVIKIQQRKTNTENVDPT
jgi:hypothetical protein